MGFYTLFLVTVLASNNPDDKPAIHHSKINAFETRLQCEFTKFVLEEKYIIPDGLKFTCIRTDEI